MLALVEESGIAIGQLQGLCSSSEVKRGGIIVRSEGELDLVSPSLIVHSMFPVFGVGRNHWS